MIHEQTLVQIRERSHLDLLDLTLLVVRRQPRALCMAAVAGIAPFAAVNAWLLANPEFPRVLWPVLLFFEAPWATAPLTVVLGDIMFGRPARARDVARRIARGLPALFFVHVVYRGLRGTVLLLPFVMGSPWFANPVILLERAGVRTAVRRSARLAADSSGGTFQMALAQLAFGLAFAACFWLGTGAAISTVFRGETTWERPALGDLGGLRFQLGVWIAIAFFGAARFFLYLDQRIRSEGWELKLRLQAAARDMEGHRR